MKRILALITVLLLVEYSLCLSIYHEQNSTNTNPKFCWRDSYNRGAGTVPNICGSFDQIGALCYNPCSVGYSRSGIDCHQNCPTDPGWADQGLFCRLVEYGRGVGYGWRGEDGFSNNGMFNRCEKDNGQGNCEQSGAIVYPKCKTGYTPAGCCICRPAVPDCNALGFNGGLDLSCAKKIITGTLGKMSCGGGIDISGGLCYSLCRDGYYGVGSICWSKTPNGWVDCGMAAATTSQGCNQIIARATSINYMAVTLVQLGLKIITNKTQTESEKTAREAQLLNQFKDLKISIQDDKAIQELIEGEEGKVPISQSGKSLKDIMKADPNTLTPEEITKASSKISTTIDPRAKKILAPYFNEKCPVPKS